MPIRKTARIILIIIAISAIQSTSQVKKDEPNVKPGSETSESLAYFKLGDFRLINNNWGSKDMNCKADYKIFVSDDKTFGWEFDRANCNDGGTRPDYPEVEFGIHPFSIGSRLATSPEFPSTDLLPIQIKDMKSASVTPKNLKIELDKTGSWNLNFEMWFTEQHPITGKHSNAFAELIVFWGWQDGRWACDKDGKMEVSGNSYRLCHQSDNWGGWRYYQFRMDGGPKRSYSSKFDIKASVDWLVKNAGFSTDLWISRFEIGTEIGDNTNGKVTMSDVTFEVNGVSKSAEFYKEPVAIRDGKKRPEIFQKSLKAGMVPARTTVEVVDLHGNVSTINTGERPLTLGELGHTLSTGVYIMRFIEKKGSQTKKTVIVPVVN